MRTASAISGERERQTFDIMMTTGITPFSVIWGKVMTAIIQSMLFVAASLPIMALTFVIGGVPWSYLFWFFAIALLASFFAASIGILCSSICKRSVSAVILSYGFYLIFFYWHAAASYFLRHIRRESSICKQSGIERIQLRGECVSSAVAESGGISDGVFHADHDGGVPCQ